MNFSFGEQVSVFGIDDLGAGLGVVPRFPGVAAAH